MLMVNIQSQVSAPLKEVQPSLTSCIALTDFIYELIPALYMTMDLGERLFCAVMFCIMVN
jgi:hypothetical protein